MQVEVSLLTAHDVAAVRTTVRSALAAHSSCVPPGAITLSIAGGAQAAALRSLQFERVAESKCLLRRMVSLCFGNYSDAFGHCVRARTLLPTLPEAAYHAYTWAKWSLLGEVVALHDARVALWLDTDVLVLQNPWTASQEMAAFARTATVSADARAKDGWPSGVPSAPQPILLHQYEGPGSNPINGGQLLTCSADAVAAVLAERPKSFDGAPLRLDQEIAHEALKRRGIAFARLPDSFAGNW